MSASLNRAELIGHLGRDPEIRTQTNGEKIATLSLATSESWTDKQSGEKREKTEWHRIVIFSDKLARVAETYCRKGSRIFVAGQIQTRKWTDKAGVERYTTEIVLSGFDSKFLLLGDPKTGGAAEPAREAAKPGGDFDDEIPF